MSVNRWTVNRWLWLPWAGFTMRSRIDVVIEVMVKGFTVGAASIGLAIIMEVTVRGLCREGYHREMLKGYICPFNREKAGSGARVPVWKSDE